MNSQELRHLEIIKMLSESNTLPVTELSEKLGVSLVTMRKDLTILEGRKLLLRQQGFVELNKATPVNKRMISNYKEKILIAAKASSLVSDGDTVIIESGSSCILLAEALKNSGKKITIITNSTFMADFISPCPSIRLILLGGEYRDDSMAVVGPVTKSCLNSFNAAYFFSGTDGFSEGGFTGDNPERVEILRAMAARAEKTVIITESEKFKKKGAMTVFALDETDYIITDDGINSLTEKKLKEKNIKLIKV